MRERIRTAVDILVAAISRWRLAEGFDEAIEDASPCYSTRGRPRKLEDEHREYGAWQRLVKRAAFEAQQLENILASSLEVLHDEIADERDRIGQSQPFVARGAILDGVAYIITEDPGEGCDARVAVVRMDRLVDLDARKRGAR